MRGRRVDLASPATPDRLLTLGAGRGRSRSAAKVSRTWQRLAAATDNWPRSRHHNRQADGSDDIFSGLLQRLRHAGLARNAWQGREKWPLKPDF
jgi:hypothetical protein